MQVLTHPNPAFLIQGFGGLPGAQYDATQARKALLAARADLLNTWRNRNVPDEGWVEEYRTRRYAFWRRAGLVRVMRCRAAVRRYEAEVREIIAARAVEAVPMRMAAE